MGLEDRDVAEGRTGAGSAEADQGDTFDQWLQDQMDEQKEDDPVFIPGADNTEFFDWEFTDNLGWTDMITTVIGNEFVAAMEALGYDKYTALNTFGSYLPKLFNDIDVELFQGKPKSAFASQIYLAGFDFLTGTAQGNKALLDFARNWVQLRNPATQGVWQVGAGKKGGGGGSGRGITPQDIRNKFDLDQLAARAQALNRTFLLTELDDPRALARQYVDAVVATMGEKAIDFDEFVKGKIRQTGRYASIYRNKPKAMSEEQYLQPYYNTAVQVLGATDEAANIAIGGAQFRASGQSYQARLQRTASVQASAPFITALEQRMRGVSKVLRG